MINLDPSVPEDNFPEVKTDFIALCEKAKAHPRANESDKAELDLCIKEWKEAIFPRGRTKIGDDLVRQLGMGTVAWEAEDLFEMFIEIANYHGMRAGDRVWYKYCY